MRRESIWFSVSILQALEIYARMKHINLQVAIFETIANTVESEKNERTKKIPADIQLIIHFKNYYSFLAKFKVSSHIALSTATYTANVKETRLISCAWNGKCARSAICTFNLFQFMHAEHLNCAFFCRSAEKNQKERESAFAERIHLIVIFLFFVLCFFFWFHSMLNIFQLNNPQYVFVCSNRRAWWPVYFNEQSAIISSSEKLPFHAITPFFSTFCAGCSFFAVALWLVRSGFGLNSEKKAHTQFRKWNG